MSLLRLLNAQGMAGLVAGIALALLLILQKGETRHWKKQAAQFEQLHARDQSAFAQTVADYRAAAAAARAADQANLERVAAEQRAINERTSNDFEARIAAARNRAEHLSAGRLREQAAGAPVDPRNRRTAPVPGLSASAGRADAAAGAGRLPSADALLATEQAIQLDELIKWVRKQAALDPAGRTAVAPPVADR